MIFYPLILKRGITLTPWLILIPKWAKGNAPYLAHEQWHQRQLKVNGTFTFWFKYLFDKGFRLQAEIEAYQAQIAAGASIHACATHLCSEYGFGLTLDEAMELLK